MVFRGVGETTHQLHNTHSELYHISGMRTAVIWLLDSEAKDGGRQSSSAPRL